MPFRSKSFKLRGSSKRKSVSRDQARDQPPLGSFPTAPIPTTPVKKSGHDASWTQSDSSIELSPPPAAERHQSHLPQIDDVISIQVGESVSKKLTKHKKERSPKQRVKGGTGQPRRSASKKGALEAPHNKNSKPTLNSCQELDLLLETIALAEKTPNDSNKEEEQKEKRQRGRYCLGKMKRSESQKRRQRLFQDDNNPLNPGRGIDFRSHDSDAASEVLIRFVSNLTLDSAGALASSAVGLCLLTPVTPESGWNHPAAVCVRDSINRHIQVCRDASRFQCDGNLREPTVCCTTGNNNPISLPVDVDEVSFVTTDPQAVTDAALNHIAEGEPVKGLQNMRVLLENQRKERGTTTNQTMEELEISKTKSKLAIFSLITESKREAWQYSTSALQTHKKAARRVHTTLSTIELGLVYLGMEKLSEALQCWREALQLACMTLGYDHFQVAILLGNLGCLHYYMGNLQAGIATLEESLGLQRQNLRSNSRCTNVELPLFQMATTMGNLALMLARCKNFESAISLMEESLAIQESVLPGTDNEAMISQKYLEMFTRLRDDTDDIIETQRESSICASNHSFVPKPLSIFGDTDGIPRRHNGNKHRDMFSSGSIGEDNVSYECIMLGSLVKPQTANQRIHSTIVQSLGSAARRQSDVAHFTSDDEATLPSTVLSTRKKQSIPVDLDGEAVIDAEFHLEEIHLQALDHLNRNEFKDALDLFESALRSHKEKYGDIHHLVGTGLHNCGIVHMFGENLMQAKLCFQEASSVRAAALGDTHPDVAKSKFKIGMIQMAAGDFECALSTFMDIVFQLQMNMSTYGFAPEAIMLNNIGVVLYEMGRDLDAFHSFFKAYQIQKGLAKDFNFAPAERALACTLGNLGFLYAMQGQYNDALDAFQEVLQILQKHYPSDHPYIVTVEENLAHVRAYGAMEIEEPRHGQSEIFANCVPPEKGSIHEPRHGQSEILASCAHLEKKGLKKIQHGQSKITACFMPFQKI